MPLMIHYSVKSPVPLLLQANFGGYLVYRNFVTDDEFYLLALMWVSNARTADPSGVDVRIGPGSQRQTSRRFLVGSSGSLSNRSFV